MGKLINSDDLIMVIKMFGGMGDVDPKEISHVTETVKFLIQATPEAKVEAGPREKEEKSVMWKDVKTAGDVLIFACGNCGERIITSKRIKAFSRCPYCGMRNKFPPSALADGGLIF